MAPATRGVKRATEEGQAQAPLAKRSKEILKQQDVAQYKLQAIAASLGQAADLGDDCRNMLIAMLPFSLVAPSDERGEQQKAVVAMVDGVFAKMTEDYVSAVDAGHTTCRELADSRGGLEGKVNASEDLAQAAAAVADAKKAVLAEKSAELAAKEGALAARVGEERSGNAALKEAQKDKDVYEMAISNNLKALRDDVLTPEQANMHQGVVMPLLKNVKADDSMLAALPGVCMKKPDGRGMFDNMVIQQLEQVLTHKVEELQAILTDGAPSATARAAAVAAADAEAKDAGATLAKATDDLNDANAALKDAQAALQAAKHAVANFEPAFKKATEQRDSKEAEFKHFQEHNVAIFNQLRDRISKRLQREQAAAAAAKQAEEVAAREAEEAAAAAAAVKQAELEAAIEAEKAAASAAKQAEEVAAREAEAVAAAAEVAPAAAEQAAPEQAALVHEVDTKAKEAPTAALEEHVAPAVAGA